MCRPSLTETSNLGVVSLQYNPLLPLHTVVIVATIAALEVIKARCTDRLRVHPTHRLDRHSDQRGPWFYVNRRELRTRRLMQLAIPIGATRRRSDVDGRAFGVIALLFQMSPSNLSKVKMTGRRNLQMKIQMLLRGGRLFLVLLQRQTTMMKAATAELVNIIFESLCR